MMETKSRKLYRFLTGPDTAEFCQRISDALAEGYQLYGSPVMVVVEGKPIVGQAVIWPDRDILDGQPILAEAEKRDKK